MTTKSEIERQRAHHARLDAMAAQCGERTQAGRDHLNCAYCAHLVAYYNDPRVRLQPAKVTP